MAKLNLGTGLASLLTGVAEGTAYNLQQQNAQAIRDKEQEKMHQQSLQDKENERTRQDEIQKQEQQARMKKVAGGFDFIKQYLDPTKPPNPNAVQDISKYSATQDMDFMPFYNEAASNLQSQPYLSPEQTGAPTNPWYVPKYEKRPVGHKGDVQANKMRQYWQYVDPNTGESQKDAKGNPYEEVTNLGNMVETNPNYTGIGSSKKTLPKPIKNNLERLSKQYTDEVGNARTVSEALQSGKIPGKLFSTPQQVLDFSNKGWMKAEEKRKHFDDYVNQLLPTAPKAQNYVDEQWSATPKGERPDKDEFRNGVIENYRNNKFDNHDVNLLAYKYLAMYGEFPQGTQYNLQSKEEEIQPEVKSGKKKVSKTSTETKPLRAKKNVPQVGDVVDGYKFKGGNPAKQENWEAVN